MAMSTPTKSEIDESCRGMQEFIRKAKENPKEYRQTFTDWLYDTGMYTKKGILRKKFQ
jgi:hypothetical protein